VNFYLYGNLILASFLNKLTEEGMQDNATTYTVNLSVAIVQEVFDEWLVTFVDGGPSIS
jgi:hypothetical protein